MTLLKQTNQVFTERNRQNAYKHFLKNRSLGEKGDKFASSSTFSPWQSIQ